MSAPSTKQTSSSEAATSACDPKADMLGANWTALQRRGTVGNNGSTLPSAGPKYPQRRGRLTEASGKNEISRLVTLAWSCLRELLLSKRSPHGWPGGNPVQEGHEPWPSAHIDVVNAASRPSALMGCQRGPKPLCSSVAMKLTSSRKCHRAIPLARPLVIAGMKGHVIERRGSGGR
jgi:hypothetical protein